MPGTKHMINIIQKSKRSKRLSVIAFLAVIGTVLAGGCSGSKGMFAKVSEVQGHWVETDDGWTLHVLRYKPSRLQ